MPRLVAILLPLVLLLPWNAGQSLAQGDDFEGLARSRPAGGTAARGTTTAAGTSAGGTLIEDGRPLTGAKVAGAGIDFEMGRDNIGFPNLHGAMSLGGMAGNCYTMAVVSKLFFERATYKPDVAEPAGFTFDGLAGALAASASSPGSAGFQVNGFASLCEMSNDTGFGEAQMFSHLAREMGVEPGGPPVKLTGKRLQMARLVQVISSIHYLHYMQYQAGHFLEAVLRLKLSGTGQVQDVTRREMNAMAAQLDGGKTGLMLLLGTAEVYGHVVLATRMTRTATADYVEVYDSNVQYGTEVRPTVFKVLKTGMVDGYFRKEADGKLTPYSIYDGDSWFADRKTFALILLPDASLEERDGKSLAKKIASADVETAYIQASGQFLTSLTEKSPKEESLRDGVLGFVRTVQSVQKSMGKDVTEQLTPQSDVAALNRVLAARSDLAVRSQFPFALPPGITLTDTHVQMDPLVTDRASIATTITLEADSPVNGLVTVLEKSATLAQYTHLADWVKTVRERVGPTRVSAHLELMVQKAQMPAGFKTRYGLMPYLQRSHLVIGDIAPSRRLPTAHQIEISEQALQGTLDTLLTKLGVIDYLWSFEYLLVPEKRITYWPGHSMVVTRETRRQGKVRFNKMQLDCQPPTIDAPSGSLALNVDVSAFVEVNPVMDGKGVNVTARPLTGRMTMDRPGSAKPGEWSVRSAISAGLKVDDGTHNLLAYALTQLADKAFPFFANRVNELIRQKLAIYAELKKPFGIRSLDVSTHALSVYLTEGVVDLEALGKHLFSVTIPATLVWASARDDRIVLGADYR